MNCKLYFVSCDDVNVFNTFISIIEARVVGIKRKHYNMLKFKRITKGFPTMFSPNNKNDTKFINEIADKIDKYNNGMFEHLVAEILEFDIGRVHMFILVDNLTTMNRLKRRFKRPNYKTLRISNTKVNNKLEKKYAKYKFDSKIIYVNNKHLLTQARQFISRHIPTIRTIKN